MTDAAGRPILRYHGGKWHLAPWIISHFPHHRIYVEPYGGGASVLLRKPRCYAEIYNDLDGEIVNLFRVARDRGAELARACALTPYARAELNDSFDPVAESLERARRTVVRSYFGYGTNVTRTNRDGTPSRTGFRSYTRVGHDWTPAGEWITWPHHLAAIIERLQGVVIEQRDAREIMAEHDDPEALHYVDPPYVHSTRRLNSRGSPYKYRHEMTDADHRDLAQTLRGLRGYVVLSGYQSALYEEIYPDWHSRLHRHYADGARSRTEAIWLNPRCADALPQRQLPMEFH
jgi:DNA adenine methylase